MKYFIISYHNIVGSDDGNLLLGVKEEVFYKQIRSLSKQVELITIRDFLLRYKDGTLENRDYCSITIDDGLKGVAAYALPILKQFNATATLYISSFPYLEDGILQAHKINMLREGLGEKEFCRQVNIRAKQIDKDIDQYVKLAMNRYPLLYRYDNVEVKRIKTFLNYGAPFGLRDEIIDYLFMKYIGKEGEIVSWLYMSEEEIRVASELDFEIGCHTHSHEILSRCSLEDQAKDILKCTRYLSSLTGVRPVTFSYPFGHRNTFGPNTISILDSMEYQGAVMVERVMVSFENFNAFKLPRFDTNDLFDMHGNYTAMC